MEVCVYTLAFYEVETKLLIACLCLILGEYFSNRDCSIQGKAAKENIEIKQDGKLSVEVKASEAVIVYLK